MAETDATTGRSIVTFDVGGTTYRVSRSTIESFPESMLARLVSETWNEQGDDTPIFIDRSGSRFEYVLDYLRDGTVDVPISMSKRALLNDFDYYGIQVDPKKILGTGTWSGLADTNRNTVEDADCLRIATHLAAYYLCFGPFDFSREWLQQRELVPTVQVEKIFKCEGFGPISQCWLSRLLGHLKSFGLDMNRNGTVFAATDSSA
jgi:BTB/POZ domain